MIKFDHLRTPIANLARSRDWYVRMLGLKIEFESGASATIGCSATSSPSRTRSSSATLPASRRCCRSVTPRPDADPACRRSLGLALRVGSSSTTRGWCVALGIQPFPTHRRAVAARKSTATWAVAPWFLGVLLY
jgi:hypothetical protein